MLQDHTSFRGELGIQGQYLDGEGDFVNDALSGSVTGREQFEVVDGVVLPVAVDVVDGFFRKQFAAEVLFHYIAMFKYVARWGAVFTRDYESNITVSGNAFRGFLFRMFFLVGNSSKQRTTGSAAQKLFSVERSAGSALNRHWVSTLDADNVPVRFFDLFSSSHAIARTIWGIFSVFFEVGANVGRFVREQLLAHRTRKIDTRNLGVFSPKISFVQAFAMEVAKALCAVTRAYFEARTTTFASFRNRHLVSLVQLALSGVAWNANLVNRGI